MSTTAHLCGPLCTKQNLSPEEERVIREFFNEFTDTVRPAGEEIIEGIRSGDIPISDVGTLRGEVQQTMGKYTSDVEVVWSAQTEDGAQVGREIAARQFNLDIAFDVVPERTIEALDDWAFEASEQTMTNIGDEVTNFLRSVHEEGLSVPDAADRLAEDYWDGRIEGWRSERIVRTETIGSSNAGHQSAYEDADSVVGKQWLATMDSRVRDTHASMHRIVTGASSNFRLPDGATAPHPGHFGLPADERVNCRCSHVAVFRDQLTDSQYATIQGGGQVTVAI